MAHTQSRLLRCTEVACPTTPQWRSLTQFDLRPFCSTGRKIVQVFDCFRGYNKGLHCWVVHEFWRVEPATLAHVHRPVLGAIPDRPARQGNPYPTPHAAENIEACPWCLFRLPPGFRFYLKSTCGLGATSVRLRPFVTMRGNAGASSNGALHTCAKAFRAFFALNHS